MSRNDFISPTPRGAAASERAASSGEAASAPSGPSSAAPTAAPRAAAPVAPPPGGDGAADQNRQQEEEEEADGRAAHRSRGVREGTRSLAVVLAPGRGNHRVDRGFEPARVIAGAELRREHVFKDVLARGIGQRAFEPVANFDSGLAVLDEDEEQGAVVELLLAHAPRLRRAD